MTRQKLALLGLALAIALLLTGCAELFMVPVEEVPLAAGGAFAGEGVFAAGLEADAAAEIASASEIASIAARSGLSEVLDELVGTRPVFNRFGEINLQGRTVLTVGEDSFIRVPSSGRVLGQIRGGSRLFETQAFGPSTEIGEVDLPTTQINQNTRFNVIRARSGWYRITLDGQNGLITTGRSASPIAAAWIPVIAGQKKKDDLSDSPNQATEKAERQILDEIKSYRASKGHS